MEPINENQNVAKKRHGCVTTWLIIMIIVNFLTAINYLFNSESVIVNFPSNTPISIVILLGILGIANVIFAILLLKWKKIGFWGFTIASLIVLIINLSIGLGIWSFFGLIGIAVLYGVLQIKKNDVPAWDNLG